MVLRSSRIVLSDAVRPGCLYIRDGVIERIAGHAETPAGAERIHDVGDLVVSPGLVDTHVHVNEPGRTDWEGFDTATRAAAAGGVTSIVDMPLNSVPATTTVAALEAKRTAARGRCHVDVAFWGGVVPGNTAELGALVEAGVRGFKCFLVPSGVEEFPPVDEGDLRAAMPILARSGVPLLVHAESPDVIDRRAARVVMALGQPRGPAPTTAAGADPCAGSVADTRVRRCDSYQTYLATRPPEAEVEAIRLMIRLARECRTRVHIVHVAAAEAVDEIARAREEGVAITAETCPHYLSFAAEEIPDGATEFKCAPPIREARHRDALWNGLHRGVLDLVATDHSPAPPAMKCPGDFLRAWGGIGSLELSLAAAWTGLPSRLSGGPGRHPYGLAPTFVPWRNPPAPMVRLATWMSTAPASLAQLHCKGRIAVGCDADLVVWDPEATRIVDPAALQQRHKLTPYAGRSLRGVVHSTFVRGRPVWEGERLIAAGTGQLL
jgi:allantoinase